MNINQFFKHEDGTYYKRVLAEDFCLWYKMDNKGKWKLADYWFDDIHARRIELQEISEKQAFIELL